MSKDLFMFTVGQIVTISFADEMFLPGQSMSAAIAYVYRYKGDAEYGFAMMDLPLLLASDGGDCIELTTINFAETATGFQLVSGIKVSIDA